MTLYCLIFKDLSCIYSLQDVNLLTALLDTIYIEAMKALDLINNLPELNCK